MYYAFMASIKRISFAGAWYHVMNRGISRQNIYYRKKDKLHFLNLIGEMSLKYKVEVHAFCLMDNHFHLMVRTPEPNISQAVHFLESAYVNRLNSVLDREGPLFKGRFHAILVDDDNYLTHLSRYIHLNPSKAAMVSKAQYYRWSSYQAYLGLCTANKWLYTETVMAYFDNDRAEYQDFVETAQNVELDNFYSKKHIPLMLGTEQFRKKVKRIVDQLPINQQDPAWPFLKDRYTCDQVCQSVMKVLGVSKAVIFAVNHRVPNVAKLIFMMICREKTGLRNREIADYLNIKSASSVPSAVARMKVLLSENDELSNKLDLCLTELLSMRPCNMQNLLVDHEDKS